MSDRVVYLMRGLPSCGKSHSAKNLAGETGVVLETDQYFYSQVGDDPTRYDYRAEHLPVARQWNFDRFVEAVEEGRSPIVVDRGNGRNAETQRYARHAVDHGYQVKLKEPESPWWQEIRRLLQHKRAARDELSEWAEKLYKLSRTTHRVPVATIRHWMDHWKPDLTVEEILAHKPDA